ncbi:unnamed protein product [Allacma fusca]|uniref:Uncharacterized protein n=1 Tax=Allacma fusca TaxID=39272 RepID=A0A8J2JLJ4_9HEXA|nr:unnamed protein product [Allacma fusca]
MGFRNVPNSGFSFPNQRATRMQNFRRKRLSERSIGKDATSVVDAVQFVSAPKEYSKASAAKKSRANQIKLVLDSARIDDTLDNSSMPPEVNDDTTTEIRDFHELSLRTYGLELEPGASSKLARKRKAAKTKIIKSLSDYFREENAKAKKQ